MIRAHQLPTHARPTVKSVDVRTGAARNVGVIDGVCTGSCDAPRSRSETFTEERRRCRGTHNGTRVSLIFSFITTPTRHRRVATATTPTRRRPDVLLRFIESAFYPLTRLYSFFPFPHNTSVIRRRSVSLLYRTRLCVLSKTPSLSLILDFIFPIIFIPVYAVT